LKTGALVTDMNQALGTSVGNGLEVLEAIDYLTGKRRDKRLHEVTIALAGELLFPLRPHRHRFGRRTKAETALGNGEPAEIFAKMVAALGGPRDMMEKPKTYLAVAPVIRPCPPPQPGIVQTVEARTLGIAVLTLGGGRRSAEDKIDHRVGLTEVAGIGEHVDHASRSPWCMPPTKPAPPPPSPRSSAPMRSTARRESRGRSSSRRSGR
jgi:thymidine phosphorylase